MPVLVDIRELVTCADGLQAGDIGAVGSGAIAWRGDRITWVGPEKDLPVAYKDEIRISANGQLVIPGLVDCHTHLCFGGWRADEFEQRCRGVGYLEIARSGGGIMRTVRQTRSASEDELVAAGRRRLDAMTALGVTSVECKSGYGLTVDDELKILRAYARLSAAGPQRITSTFLGAHVVPLEYREDRAAYVQLVCDVMLPRVAEAQLATFCDVFVEDGAFTPAEARIILSRAASLGLAGKLHVDQLSDGGGAALAAEVGATSADHLEHTGLSGIDKMVKQGVVPVALPVASLYLKQQPMPCRNWIEAGAEVAVATDFNPGSAPTYHLPLAMTLACTMNGLTPNEALLGATRTAARAIKQEDTIGSLEPGKMADLVIVQTESVDQWLYHFQPNQVVSTFIGGEEVKAASTADLSGKP